jgi:phage-related protein
MLRGRTSAGSIPMALTFIGEGFNNFITEFIYLSGLQFRPGDEIIIDTTSMTVTNNGQNIMRFVHRDSEFFLLNPGNNEISYQTAATSSVNMRILWKDAWL